MFKKLSPKFRSQLSDKIMDWANLVFAGLVVAQAISGQHFNWIIAVIGGTMFFGGYMFAYKLMEKR